MEYSKPDSGTGGRCRLSGRGRAPSLSYPNVLRRERKQNPGKGGKINEEEEPVLDLWRYPLERSRVPDEAFASAPCRASGSLGPEVGCACLLRQSGVVLPWAPRPPCFERNRTGTDVDLTHRPPPSRCHLPYPPTLSLAAALSRRGSDESGVSRPESLAALASPWSGARHGANGEGKSGR